MNSRDHLAIQLLKMGHSNMYRHFLQEGFSNVLGASKSGDSMLMKCFSALREDMHSSTNILAPLEAPEANTSENHLYQ